MDWELPLMIGNHIDWPKLARTVGFLSVSAWLIWLGFFKKELHYPFSERPMPLGKGRLVSLFVALVFLLLALLSLTT